MTVASYPNAIVPWTNRVDKINTVKATDPNTLAAEVIAIESTLGTNPQNEANPPMGSAVKYSTVSARIHDVQVGGLIPVATVTNGLFTIVNNNGDQQNSYSVLFDPFAHYNGIDLTVKAPGWYIVTAHQKFNWAASGLHGMQVYIGGALVAEDHWNWTFSQNTTGNYWYKRSKMLQCFWQGIIQKNQRISVVSRNGSNVTSSTVSNAYLKLSYVRSVPTTAKG